MEDFGENARKSREFPGFLGKREDLSENVK